MPAKLPYHKWFWADWFRDTRCLSALARGVWIDMIGYLRESTPSGQAVWDHASWCRWLTLTDSEWRAALEEFKKFQVCTVVENDDGTVTVLSRRIKREKRAIKDNKLRQREFRSNRPVTEESQPGKALNHSQSQKQSHIQRSEAESEALKEKSTSARSRHLTDEEFIQAIKVNPAYTGIDVDRELAKMDLWFLTPKGRGRKKTQGFVLNWLSKVDKPMDATGQTALERFLAS